MTGKASWWMPYPLAKGSMALAENWAWAVTRVVAEKQDAPQGCGRIRPCWRRGRVRDAKKHNNSAELITFSSLSSTLWPDAGCRMPDAGCRMPDAG
ncbi:MAG: hypothetical protein F4Z73_05490, partial [Synechococcus sp. SB0668_bin_13]|nr:hypothetical protein [Synechococcus sp. SB0668_bin_13]